MLLKTCLRGTCIVIAVLILCLPSRAEADKRVALVIGNAAYREPAGLQTPRNDATDIAAAFTFLGFEVIQAFDADKTGMDQQLSKFTQALKGADIGVFFYAGHALQVSGVNYLVPVDATLSSSLSIDPELIRLDLAQRAMASAAKVNLLFLDACRDTPLARNLAHAMGQRAGEIGQGLAPAQASAGSLVSFATYPGNQAVEGTGRNSPYAAALAKRLASGGHVQDVLAGVRDDVLNTTGNRQVPWEHAALAGLVSLGTPRPSGQTALVQPPVVAQPPAPPALPVAPPSPPSAGTPTPPPAAMPTPSRLVMNAVLKQRDGKAALGVQIARSKPVILRGHGVSEEDNVLVIQPSEDGAAKEAGLMPGDLILRLDGQDVRSAQDLIAKVTEKAPGASVAIELSRFASGPDDFKRWLRQTAEQGDTDAMEALAGMLDLGWIFRKDEAEARRWYELAVEERDTPQNTQDVLARYRKAAENGNPVAMYKLSHELPGGEGKGSGLKEGAFWAFMALQKGHPETVQELITETGASRSSAFRKALQERMSDSSHYDGRIDGNFNAKFLTSLQNIVGIARGW